MLENLVLPKKAYPCKVRELAEAMTEKDRAVFLAAVVDPAWPIITLSEELRARGVDISPTPLTKHRRKACSCA